MISLRMQRRIRRRPGVVVATLAALLFGLGGCDSKPAVVSDTVVIDPGVESKTTADASNTKLVTMLMPFSGRNVELIIWRQAAMEEMGRFVGRTGAILDVRTLKQNDPPARQAEMVREAAVRGTSGLIVVAADPKSIAPALIVARDKGIHVVLLSRPVPVRGKRAVSLGELSRF